MIILLPFKVQAKIYGIEYLPIENLDLKVDEIKKYRYYKENKVESYFIEGDNPIIFKKKDEFYFTNYSEWLREKPALKPNREIKERNVYIYQKWRQIKNAYIEVLDDTEAVLEFAIYLNGYKAPNQSFCSNCTSGYYMYINDDKYDRAIKIDKLTVYFNDYFNREDIVFKVMFNKENVKYKIVLYGNEFDDVLYEKEFISDLNFHEYTIDDLEIKNAFEEEIIKYEEDNSRYLKDSYKEYAYKDKYYLYEYLEKEYYPTYEVNVDGYTKDESDYIIEKKYSYLETANIKDQILINSESYNLNDYIKTNLPFEVASNIDISKNGKYKIKYIFQNKTIEKDVEVKTNNEYIKSLEEKVESKNKEIEEVIQNKNEIIERLESNIKSKDEIISKKNVERTVSKTPILPVVLITIGVMLLIICIIKSFKKVSN